MKRISLIEPASPGYHFFSGVRLPRLGLPIIGAILKQRGHDVRIYCEDIQRISPLDYLKIAKSDVIGISATTSTAPRAYALARRFHLAKVPIILGGVHPTFMPEEGLEFVDYCVRGEGEETIVELLDALDGERPLSTVAGLSYRSNGEIHHNADRALVQDLDSLPSPDLALIRGHERIKIAPIVTSRGCPFDCNFCSVTSMFGRGYRVRSIDLVMEELARSGGKEVFFYDDNFVVNRERTKELLRRMIKERVTPRWSAQVRVDVVKDEEILELMKKANCTIACVGFESINPGTLEQYNKGQGIEDVERSIRLLHRHGIGVHGMFVLGADEDDVHTAQETVEFAKRHGIDRIQFMVLTPIPGSRTYETINEANRIFSKDWRLYDGLHVVFEPKQMTPLELQLSVLKAMGGFYSPWECFKLFCKFKFMSAIMRYIEMQLLMKWRRSNKGFLTRLGEKAVSADGER